MLRPMVLAKLLQAAHVRAGEHLLDVGSATGYAAALLARLGASVVALEEDPDLAAAAKAALAAIGAANTEVVVGPLAAGWPAGGPYDGILLNGAAEVVPEAFAGQLKPEGWLIGVGGRPPACKGMIYRLSEGSLVGRPLFDAAATLLPGFKAPPSSFSKLSRRPPSRGKRLPPQGAASTCGAYVPTDPNSIDNPGSRGFTHAAGRIMFRVGGSGG